VIPVAAEIQKQVNSVFKYHNITVNVKRTHPLRGQIYWVAKCSKQKSENCKFIINISKKEGDSWARVTKISAAHSHTIQTPSDVQAISGSNRTLIVAADLLEYEVEFKKKITANVKDNLNLLTLRKQICAETFGPNCTMDMSAINKFRLWTEHVVASLFAEVNVTRHCKDDNVIEYLNANYAYVVHENGVGTSETRFLFWSSKQQQQQYRRYCDVTIIDGTAGKNAFNWCILLAVCIDSEHKSQIVGQMFADSECKEAYGMMLKHMIQSGNATGSTEYLPDLFLTDEDPGFISAYKDLCRRYPTKSMDALRCHWHLIKDITLHFACIHSKDMDSLNAHVHALFRVALHAKTETDFEEAWEILLKAVESYTAVHKYLSNTLYVNRHRWAAYARRPLRTLMSNASGRVEGQNAMLGADCNRKTKLVDCARTIAEINNRQLLNEVKFNGPQRTKAPQVTFQDSQFQQCLDAAIPHLSTFAYGELRGQMQQSLYYNCATIPSEDSNFRVHWVTPRQSCFVTTVDEAKGRTVKVNIVDGTHACCCMFEEDMAIPCRHYFTCMTHSREVGLPFNMSMIPRRWFRKDKYEVMDDILETNLYVSCMKYESYLGYSLSSPAIVTPKANPTDQAIDMVDQALWVDKEKTNLLYAISKIYDSVLVSSQADSTLNQPSTARYAIQRSFKEAFPQLPTDLLLDDGIHISKRIKQSAGRPVGATGRKFGNKRIMSAIETGVVKAPVTDAVKLALALEKKEKRAEVRRLVKEQQNNNQGVISDVNDVI
jgi:hypothetical protein